MAINREELIEAIGSMSVLELSELVKALEDKFGVSAAMPMAGMMPMQMLRRKRKKKKSRLNSP